MMKHKLLALAIVATAILLLATPVYAYIANPSSTPEVESINIYRNVLEKGDFAVFVYENTPYASLPSITYNNAFVWRFMATDGTTELAQTVGFNYYAGGYGYNVIGFYFNNTSAPPWEQNYFLNLTGTPLAFASPPNYQYPISTSHYSSLTNTDEVKAAISDLIITLAKKLNSKWGVTSTANLLYESETGTVLSSYGQSFFRGAIYGIQAMAPSAFSIAIANVDATDRTWVTTFISRLKAQHTRTALEPAFKAGEDFFNVNYNLMGLLGVIFAIGVIIFGQWYISGGNMWRGIVESAGVLVIAGRLALVGLGEIALIAAICWLYIDMKVWKLI